MSAFTALFESSSGPSLIVLAKATVLLLVAIIGTAALRRSSAGMRHLVWVVTLAALLLLPSVITRLPLRLAVLPATLGPTAQATLVNAATGRPLVSEAVPPANESESAGNANAPASGNVAASERDTATSWSSLSLSPLAALLAVWGAGVLLCLLWLAYGVWSVSRIVRRGEQMNAAEWENALYEVADRIGLGHAPRLVVSRDVRMPFAAGLVRPVIVLPHDAHEWSADRRTSVLLHELAHIKRRDLVGHTLGRLACAVYWFHPLVWTAARRLRIESERACDDIALSCGARASDYAEHLLDIVTAVRRHFTPAVALAMAHRKEFEGRMLAILDPDVRRVAPSRRQTISSVAALAALVLFVGAAAPATPNDNSLTQSRRQPADTSDFKREATPVSRPADTATPSVASNTHTAEATPEQQAEARRDGRLDSSISRIVQDAARDGSRIAVETVRDLLGGSLGAAPQQRSDERARLLINVLRTDTSATLRRIAAWGLSDYAHESAAAAALADALRRDASAEVREMAAWALGDTDRSSAAAEALSHAATSDADDKVRATALWSLGQMSSESSLDVLAAALASKDQQVRETAMWAIGNVAPDKAPAGVLTGLTDSAPRVRKLAAWALYQIGDPAAIPALESALNTEKDLEIRRAYVRALASTGERSAEALSKLLGSNDPEIRTMAVRALAGGNAAGPWPWPWPKPRPNP